MTAVLSGRADTLPGLLRRAAVSTWYELPRVIVIGLAGLASLVPFALALVAQAAPLVALATLPPALWATGAARFAALIAQGSRPRLRDAARVDGVLALTLAATFALAGWMLATPDLVVPGSLVAAVVLLLAPLALAYGAVRGRIGLTTWRGAVILAAYRPSWALTLLALTVLGAFAVVATAGVLGIAAPFIGVLASGLVATLLDEIDGRAQR